MEKAKITAGGPSPSPISRGPRSQVVPKQAKWFQLPVAWLVFILERLMAASWRCEWLDRSGLRDAPDGQPVIFCLWHNRLAISMVVHQKYHRKLAALISASKDGALLASILEKYGVQPVRGSSSRRGPQALLELTTRSGAGYDVAITPDGPRGPRYIVQKGVLDLARLTGRPIIPVTYNTRWKITMKGWDHFHIPLPFAKCEIVLNQPILVPRDASESERENLRIELENSLRGSSWD